jgi:hypothetical protein
VISHQQVLLHLIIHLLELVLSLGDFHVFVLLKVAQVSVWAQMINGNKSCFLFGIKLGTSDYLLHIYFTFDVL